MQQCKIIRPQAKMAVRFAVIMAVLFSVAAAMASKFCITFVIATLAISFFVMIGFAYLRLN